MVCISHRSFTRIAFACAVALTGGAAHRAHAAGFLIYDLTGESLGKGSAVSASTSEPGAVFFNPAALSFMPGVQASVSSVIVHNRQSFEPADGGAKVNGDPGTFVLPSVFATARVHERLAVGIGGYPAFGLGISWPENWIGREDAIDASIQTFNINPTVSVTLVPDRLSFAAGYQLVRAAVDFTTGLPAALDGTVQIGGTTWGHGLNAALLYRPRPDRFHVAATYRSRVKLAFDGRADFDPAPEFARNLPDQPGSAEITLPDVITLGFMWRPTPNLTLNFDPHYVLWSTYDELRLDFESAPDTVMVRNNKDVFTLRAGADYLTRDGLALRAGFIYDQNPAPKRHLAPSLPDADRLDFGLGFGVDRGWLRADVGYLLVYFLPSDSTTGQEGPIGTYKAIAHLVGLTVTGRFGAGASR